MGLSIRSFSCMPYWTSPFLKNASIRSPLYRLPSGRFCSFVHLWQLRPLATLSYQDTSLSIFTPDRFKAGPLGDLPGYLGAAFAGLFIFSSCQAEERSLPRKEQSIKEKNNRNVSYSCVPLGYPSDKVEIRDKQQVENVWKASLKEFSAAHPSVLKWLKVCAFLSSEQIPLSWLKHWVKEPENVGQIVSSLVDFNLIQYDSAQNFFSISNLLQEVIREEISNVEKQQILGEVIGFFKSHTSMNLMTTKATSANRYFVPHIDALISHTNGHLYPDAVELLCRSGNYFLQQGHLLEARNRFQKALQYCQDNSQGSLLRRCEQLRTQGKRLPSYYGKALHYMGIIYFRLGQFKMAEDLFNRSIEVRNEIDRRPELYEDPDPIDSIIFVRQGKGWLLLESRDPKDLIEAENIYLAIQKQNPDSFNQRYCNLQLAKVYHKLAKVSNQREYYTKAYLHLSQTLDGLEGLAKKGEYYLMQSQLYLDRNSPYYNLEQAEEVLKQVIQGESS